METQSQNTIAARRTIPDCAEGLQRFFERHKLAVVLFLTLLYFGGTVLRARAKPFWFDELLTVLAARQPTFAGVIQGGRDMDLTPPFTDLVGHLVYRLAGSGEIVFRLPAMIGFWVFCLCLFAFAARRVNICFALTALLLPFVTAGGPYSFEARSYALMLGFCGIALLCWQSAASGRKRGLALAGICLGIAGAVSCHYYGVFIYLPLAGAEAFRSFRTRRIDKAIWAAFVLGAVPLVISLIRIVHVTNANQHSVTPVSRQDYLWYYVLTFGTALWFLIPVFVLWSVWLIMGGDSKEPEAHNRIEIPDHELLAALLLFLIPVAAITLALAVPPHIFTGRYALPSIGGFALLTSLLAANFAKAKPVLGMAFLLPALALFAVDMVHPRQPFQNPLQKEPLLAEALEHGPVVVDDYAAFVQFWYYAPEALKPRLLYLSDQDASVEFSHIDDIMQPFQKYGLPVVKYKDFATPGKDFLLYYTTGVGWVTQKVLADGGNIQLVSWNHSDKALFHIQLR